MISRRLSHFDEQSPRNTSATYQGNRHSLTNLSNPHTIIFNVRCVQIPALTCFCTGCNFHSFEGQGVSLFTRSVVRVTNCKNISSVEITDLHGDRIERSSVRNATQRSCSPNRNRRTGDW